jgi:hypothetical protein
MTKARDLSKLLSTANGKIAGANLDVSFENITDTGTEGTRVATGTTGQRGSTAGQLRFNTTTGLAEYYTGTAFKSIDAPPTVSSLDVTEVDSQAGGNQTIVITGSSFSSGAIVTFIGASGTDFNASTVTVDSDTQITAVAPKASFLNAQEPYGVKVENTSGLTATLASQINVDTAPSWSTASGSLGNVGEGNSANFSISATDADGDTVSYSETTSSLSGAGFSLNSSTGAITGTANLVSGDTTTSFTLRATANSKTSDRSFSIITKNIVTNALLFDATNLSNSNMPMPSTSGAINGFTPNTAVTFSNINGSSGKLYDAIMVEGKSRLDGYYNQTNIKNMGTSFWTMSAPDSNFSRNTTNNSNFFGVYSGGGANEVWFVLDMGENPSFKIRRLTGSAIWRTASADFQLYGSNDVSNLNASSWSTTGLTNLFNIANPSQPWDSGWFTGAYYRYYIFRIYGSSNYDWGWNSTGWYGDYY